jgi:5-formyltetrahydrofolate cyclo-ligase
MNYSKKQQIRKVISERKKTQTENLFLDYSSKLFIHLESLPVFQNAKTILLYHSLKDEVRTHAFIEKWKNEKILILPVVNGENLILKEYNDSSKLLTGAYGIQEPTGELFSDYNKIDLAIIPGVSFDKVGNRLGRGKGYYDRLLPKIKAFKIGICFSFQLSEDIPTEPHDTKMNLVVTENGILNEK